MKTKLFKTLAATAMSVLAIACAKEPVADNGQQAGVSFTIEVPGVPATRAYGEAEKATELYYQVFDNAGNTIDGLGVQHTHLVGKAAKVSFQLVKDQTYNFVFWAQTTETGYYTIDETEGLKKITADYTTHKDANDENRDAFFAVETITVSGPVAKEVKLTRPFAQINIATAGEINAGATSRPINFTGATSSVTVKNIPTVFTPLANDTAPVKTAQTVTFETSAVPDGNLTLKNGDVYKYMAMNYVFAPKDGSVYDITATLTVEGKKVPLSVPAAPLKRNWRTNIFGDLLTTSADFNVIVEPEFDDDTDVDVTNVKTVAGFNAALANGGKVTVTGDVTSTGKPFSVKKENTEIIISEGVTVDAELTGYSSKTLSYFDNVGYQVLSGEGTIMSPKVTNLSSPVAAIELEDNSNHLVINGNLTVKARKGTKSERVDACMIIRAGKVTINGGHFITDTDVDGKENPAILLYSPREYRSELVINDGIFESLIEGNSQYLINIQDEYRDHCKVSIYGGKFKGFDPGNVNEGTITSFLAEGYKSTKVGDYYVVTKADVTPVASNEGLNAAFNEAVNAGKEITVNLSEGTFNWPDSKDGNNVKFPKTINVVGTSKEDCFVKFSAGSYPEDSDVIFENVTIDNAVGCAYAEGSLAQMVRVKDVTVKNCIIKNQFRILAKGIVNIKNCQFINTNSSGFDGYCLNYYGYDGSTVNVENCTFDTVQKAIVIYSEGHVTNYTLNVKDCKFTASDSSTDKAAVQMHTEYGIHGNVTINNCTATGFKANTLSPEGLWWEGKNNVTPKVPTKNFTIKVGGTTVQTAE